MEGEKRESLRSGGVGIDRFVVQGDEHWPCGGGVGEDAAFVAGGPTWHAGQPPDADKNIQEIMVDQAWKTPPVGGVIRARGLGSRARR